MLKRMKHGVRVTALVLGLATSIGLAFFVGSFIADGSHTGTAGSGGTGSQTLPVHVNFPDAQLTPTHAVPLTAEVENTSSKQVTFGGINPKITTGTAGCEASWFKVVATGSKASKWNEIMAGNMPIEAKYAPGTSPVVTDAGTELTLVLNDTGTNQEKCEGAPVTVAFHLSE